MLANALADLMERFDNEVAMTIPEVVDEVERIAEKAKSQVLLRAIAKYRVQEREELTKWGIRGDMESVEDEFIETVRSMAGKREANINESEQKTISWNYSLINDVIKHKRPYPAVLIDKVIGAKEHELPVLLQAGYKLDGDNYTPEEGDSSALK